MCRGVQSTRCYHSNPEKAFRLGNAALISLNILILLLIQTRQEQVFLLRTHNISQDSQISFKYTIQIKNKFALQDPQYFSKYPNITMKHGANFLKGCTIRFLKKKSTTAVLPWCLHWSGSEVEHGKLSLLFQ